MQCNEDCCLLRSRIAAHDAVSELHEQVFKFSMYLAVPIFMTLAIAGSPKNLEALIKNVRHASFIMSGLFRPGTLALASMQATFVGAI